MISSPNININDWMNSIEAPPGTDPEEFAAMLNKNPELGINILKKQQGEKSSLLNKYRMESGLLGSSLEDSYNWMMSPHERGRRAAKQQMETQKQMQAYKEGMNNQFSSGNATRLWG